MLANKVIEAMDGWDFQGEVATTDLVADQQEYVFPSDILKFKRAEISYDGVTWRRLKLIDINNKPGQTNTATISNEISRDEPEVDIMDNSLFIYPTPTGAVSGGLKIWYEKEVTDLSEDTDEPNLIEAYHPGLAYGAAIDYFSKYREVEFNSTKANDNQLKLDELILDMQKFYRRRTQDQDYIVQGQAVDYDYGRDY